MVDRDDNHLEVAKGFAATQVIHNDLGHAIKIKE
jgi:hypothetical protein